MMMDETSFPSPLQCMIVAMLPSSESRSGGPGFARWRRLAAAAAGPPASDSEGRTRTMMEFVFQVFILLAQSVSLALQSAAGYYTAVTVTWHVARAAAARSSRRARARGTGRTAGRGT
jgi:hypothetical protein